MAESYEIDKLEQTESRDGHNRFRTTRLLAAG